MQTVQKLIDQFIPNNYKLSLVLNRKDRTFDGTVAIYGETQANFNSITVHSKDLEIKSIIMDGKQADFSFGENDALAIKHPDINIGKHLVFITFSGKITDAMHGLYPCYFEHNGINKELLATQFESHHAREVFPCIDEPAAKATFDVTLTTEKDITVLGNMPVKTQKIEDDKLVTQFETTPIMSSYLLAWVVGEMHKKTAFTKGGVEVNVWATPAQSGESLDFALDIATRSIDFFDEYFGTPYPLPKSDNVALPDFSSGAMENWGLVTYRESALLAEPSTTSISGKHYIATVIAHELSHQWFGNLVTMKWWNDLWLNESFASLVEYTAVNALEPTWDVWLDFASFESSIALRRDSLDGVQPVQTDVSHPSEIGTLFDGAIVYAKGARLLQMLQHYIGEDAFQAGLKLYFKEHAYKNTEAADLWASFSKVSDKDVAGFMNQWISKPGFPILHVSRHDGKIYLSQERMASRLTEPSDYLWPITLNSNCSDLPIIFSAKELIVNTKSDLPLRFNINNYAHFITHYSDELFNQIICQIKNNELQPIDRLQILNEQILLANAGVISSSNLILLLNSLENESTESVWDVMCMAIGELKKFVENDKDAELKLRTFVGKLVSKQYQRLGWTSLQNETEEDTKLRSIIISLMIYSEDKEAIEIASNMYKSTPIENLDPELRCLVLASVVRQGKDDKIVEDLINIYKITDLPDLKQDINAALTSTQDTEAISKLLDMSKDSSIVRVQDNFRWIVYLLRNKYGRSLAWQWIRDNWDWISKAFGGDKSYDDYPRYAATALSTKKQLEEYCDFFNPLISNPSLTRVIKIGINEIKNRADVLERDTKTVCDTLLGL